MQDSRRLGSARYAVVFRDGMSAPAAGALVADDERLLLEGRSGEGHVELSVPYAELLEVRIGRRSEERLNGHPALVIVRRSGPPVQIDLLGMGLLHEVAELLAGFALEQTDRSERVALTIPLKAGCLERAKEIVAQGPPFDPTVLNLARHQVFLTPSEAVFVFVGPQVRETLERALRNPSLWRAGLAWSACITGRPRLSNAPESRLADGVEPAYDWAADVLDDAGGGDAGA